MKSRVLYPILCLFIIPLTSFAKELSVERIYSSPSLSGDSLRGLKMSPDGSRVTFLKGKDNDYERLDLWEYHVKSQKTQMLFDADDLHPGKENLSDEERARRERLRLRGSGIVSYQWSDDGKALLFPLAGDIYYYKLGEQKATKLVETPEFETDIQFSPNSNYISFIRNQNIFILNINSGKEEQLTRDGGGVIKNGMAEFVAQEEMGRMTGLWWSNDETKIAFTRVDESPVEEVTRSEIYAEEIKIITQRYPFAGKANVEISLGVIDIKNKKMSWVDLGKDADFYLPRVKWTKDNSKLSYQWQSRDQKKLDLNIYNLQSKTSNSILQENHNTWVNLHKDLYYFSDNKKFIWSSEKDGYKHLYLHALDGKLISQLTKGEWVVDKLEYVDEGKGLIYFTARKDSPIEKHLYSVSIENKKITKVTRKEGVHSVTFAKNRENYIDSFSSPNTPPQISLNDEQGKHLAWLSENKVDENHPLFEYMSNWIVPEFDSFLTNDKTRLYYRMYKPAQFDPKKKYPVLVYLYGGPHAQMVTKSWGGHFLQYMAQQGYVVFTVDNRGSFSRGKLFEDSIYQAMGNIEVQDQVAGVKFLHTKKWVDKDKIGIHGHSYGGYMTLMAMFKAPEYFKAGVSGAPVTDWSLYDTHYTERYMGNPNKNAEAYKKSSVFPYVTQLKSPLLIYHGMADDNVLFKNSTRLYKALQDNNISFMTMDYPGKKHSIRGKKTQMHRLNMIRNFFDLHFGIKR